MGASPYASPLPYGEWALSLVILVGGFYWVRAEETATKCRTRDSGPAGRRQTAEGENKEQQEQEDGAWGGRTSSSAYQTDYEADRMQQQNHQQQHIVGRRHDNRQNNLLMAIRAGLSSPPTLLCGAEQTAAVAGGEECANQTRASSPSAAAAAALEVEAAAASSGGAFPVTRAAVDATRAVEKSHLDYVVDRADRWRLEKEAFRIRVQQHVGRELDRKNRRDRRCIGLDW
ncbi:unnamed protein product [Pylaiella littoralis]